MECLLWKVRPKIHQPLGLTMLTPKCFSFTLFAHGIWRTEDRPSGNRPSSSDEPVSSIHLWRWRFCWQVQTTCHSICSSKYGVPNFAAIRCLLLLPMVENTVRFPLAVSKACGIHPHVDSLKAGIMIQLMFFSMDNLHKSTNSRPPGLIEASFGVEKGHGDVGGRGGRGFLSQDMGLYFIRITSP